MQQTFTFVAVVIALMGSVLLGEVYLLKQGQSAVATFERANAGLEQGNQRLSREISALKGNRSRIDALYLRLKDAMYHRQTSSGSPGLMPGHALKDEATDPEPDGIRHFRDSGVIAQLARTNPGEMALTYEAGVSRLELHRLVPLLAEQENSNPFLFIDRLSLSRPNGVPAFSPEPTYLEARFTARLLITK